MRLSPLAPFALVSVLVPLTSCAWLFDDGGDDDGGAAPCDDDVLGCDDDISKFLEDPSCLLQGPLELQLGEGEHEFSPLEPDELPELHFGFQGGQHVWMAVQVKNPDLERRQLKIRTKLDYCNDDCDVLANWATDIVRELVVDDATIRITPEGWMEQTRILVTVFDWVGAKHQRVEMLVTDPCGRQGFATSG